MQKPSQNFPAGYFTSKCFRNNQKIQQKSELAYQSIQNAIVIDDDQQEPSEQFWKDWKESQQNNISDKFQTLNKQPKQNIKFTFCTKKPEKIHSVQREIETNGESSFQKKKYIDQSTQTKSSKKVIQDYIMNEIKKQAIYADQKFYQLPLNHLSVVRAFKMVDIYMHANKYFNSLKSDQEY